jgi:hypothetical protein
LIKKLEDTFTLLYQNERSISPSAVPSGRPLKVLPIQLNVSDPFDRECARRAGYFGGDNKSLGF